MERVSVSVRAGWLVRDQPFRREHLYTNSGQNIKNNSPKAAPDVVEWGRLGFV